MKVTITVNGRFHAFDLVAQLHKYGMLHQLMTSYPKFKACEWGIPSSHIRTLLPAGVLNRMRKYFPLGIRDALIVFQKEWFDRWAAGNIPGDTDLVVGWSGNSLHTIRNAKRQGMKTIIERGSAHILYQQHILREEYNKFGITPHLAPFAIVQKELQEYDEADYISIPSLFVKRTFLEKGILEEKLIHVPYGVELSNFRSISKEDKTFRIIHCGAITLQKGVHYLLQAFYELNLPNSELWLIGRMSDEIQPFLQQYDNGKVFRKGPFSQNELYRYYSQGSVCCLVSIQDGFGMVIHQAMACGLPVIHTTNTGGADIVRPGVDGFEVPIRDVDALKKKILYLYERPEICLDMGEKALQRVNEGFSWDDYGERIVQTYRRILCL